VSKRRHSIYRAGRSPIWIKVKNRQSPAMTPPEEPMLGSDEPQPEPSRSEEARWTIQEYADGLGEIIKKLCRRFN